MTHISTETVMGIRWGLRADKSTNGASDVIVCGQVRLVRSDAPPKSCGNTKRADGEHRKTAFV